MSPELAAHPLMTSWNSCLSSSLHTRGEAWHSSSAAAHLHNGDAGRAADGRQAVRDHNSGAALHALGQSVLHQALALCVQGAGSLQANINLGIMLMSQGDWSYCDRAGWHVCSSSET